MCFDEKKETSTWLIPSRNVSSVSPRDGSRVEDGRDEREAKRYRETLHPKFVHPPPPPRAIREGSDENTGQPNLSRFWVTGGPERGIREGGGGQSESGGNGTRYRRLWWVVR